MHAYDSSILGPLCSQQCKILCIMSIHVDCQIFFLMVILCLLGLKEGKRGEQREGGVHEGGRHKKSSHTFSKLTPNYGCIRYPAPIPCLNLSCIYLFPRRTSGEQYSSVPQNVLNFFPGSI